MRLDHTCYCLHKTYSNLACLDGQRVLFLRVFTKTFHQTYDRQIFLGGFLKKISHGYYTSSNEKQRNFWNTHITEKQMREKR